MSVEFSLLFFVYKVWVTVGGWVGGKNSLLSRIRKGDFFKRLSCSLCKFFVIHIRERREPSTSRVCVRRSDLACRCGGRRCGWAEVALGRDLYGCDKEFLFSPTLSLCMSKNRAFFF